MPIGRRPEPAPESHEASHADEEQLKETQRSIGERVRFWEEQDKINQVLIDRLIRQNKLLSDHVKSHENLPEVADRAVRKALSDAKAEQQKQYQSIIEQLSTTFRDTVRRLLAEERTRQKQQHEHALAAVRRQWESDTQRRQTKLHFLIALLTVLSVFALALSILSLTVL